MKSVIEITQDESYEIKSFRNQHKWLSYSNFDDSMYLDTASIMNSQATDGIETIRLLINEASKFFPLRVELIIKEE